MGSPFVGASLIILTIEKIKEDLEKVQSHLLKVTTLVDVHCTRLCPLAKLDNPYTDF